jgi:hypothetical protein
MIKPARRTVVSFLSGTDTISGTLFIPGADIPLPALIICHGALDFRENYFDLCEYLAGQRPFGAHGQKQKNRDGAYLGLGPFPLGLRN